MEISGINQQSQKLSKKEKKLRQKQMKVRHTLLRHEGIECVSYPTKSLVIANGGLGNGVSRCQVLKLAERCGLVEALLMPPNKPYSFLKYEMLEDSKRAYDSLNGEDVASEDNTQNVVLYFNFVEKVPWEDMTPSTLPPGLRVIEEVVSPEEEGQLLECIDWGKDEVIPNAQKSLKHRRVKHFGYEFQYDNNNVDRDRPLPGGLPDICNTLLAKWLKMGYIKESSDQLTINQYEPGQGIPPHIDTHSAFEDEIISLSLGAGIVMDFKHPDGQAAAVMLPQRSLLVMSGESRYLWTHGITPRKFDIVQASQEQKLGTVTADIGDLTLNKRGTRTSFTFRKVRRGPCKCSYPSVCDSQCKVTAPSFPDSESEASKLEKEYVHDVYEQIAQHFSSTRHSPWPRVVEFLRALPRGAIVADVGCGNGKYLGVSKDMYVFGCDRSEALVNICGEKKFQAFVCDALSVPIRSGSCDACISIAVIHHFSTAERRLATLSELVRLLRPGGRALVYVWALEQEYNKQKSKYLKGKRAGNSNMDETISNAIEEAGDSESQDSAQPDGGVSPPKDRYCSANEAVSTRLPVHTNRTSFDSQDLLVPWHLKDGTKKKMGHTKLCQPVTSSENSQKCSPVFHRYYHVFCEGELELLCKRLNCVNVQESYYDQGNWCVILEKK
ncbi:alkylated DNA repair protein alkB homolog 8 isoform X1 [Anolis carolinensis]|uniref:AlkB homolog 8, tRNA methyltransferase n=1 Tax=Anolis carolinensis TaxID=28377 RepID=G1KKM9_ANOCA|nr:PREDICTED: alkylated DNA repair protein alkB homolog 8 [Anolis carolinensis]XP_008106231.1 PREDICTED: alkylated DNA repair protein alkB homolog 8 [Anolis carolinensis]XP_008106232.1 PREDICTED: alkylated DNA repair protein alkB homolog 8 [Anolis carolinensis]|eukprot:XP_003219355.1 PREDICTED: alkylated DNA repair protein alkB homolog 8 [Anolis carolinensis]